MRFFVYLVTFLLAGYVSAQEFPAKIDGYYTIDQQNGDYVSLTKKSGFRTWILDNSITNAKKSVLNSEDGYKFVSYEAETMVGMTFHVGVFVSNDNKKIMVKASVQKLGKYSIMTEGIVKDVNEMVKLSEAMGHLLGYTYPQEF